MSKYLDSCLSNLWTGEKNKLNVVTKKNIYLTIPKRKKNTIKAIIEHQSPVEAPIKKGDQVGVLKVYIAEDLIENVPLYSSEDIKRSNIFSRLFKSLNYLVWGDV